MLRKRHRDNKKELIKMEEEARKPKNFALKMVDKLSDTDLEKARKVKF